MLEFFNQTYPKAKKEHTCDLCNQKIAVGEKYSRFTGKYDGDMLDVKHHLLCERMCKAYCAWANETEYANEDVQEWLREEYCHICENYEECTVSEFECPIIRENFVKGGSCHCGRFEKVVE